MSHKFAPDELGYCLVCGDVARIAAHDTPDFTKYPVRTCYTLHFCEICQRDITLGQQYYDGGYGRRAHVGCADEQKAEAT